MVKILGPYLRKDGRKHVIHYSDGVRRTQSYPRYLMEQHLGRALLPEETVDHIDGDFRNDDISNYQLLSLADNARKAVAPAEKYEFICPVCGVLAVKSASQVRHNRKLGRAGPYCSKRCAGKRHH